MLLPLSDEQVFDGVWGGAEPRHPQEWLAIENHLREKYLMLFSGRELAMMQRLNDDEWYRRSRIIEH